MLSTLLQLASLAALAHGHGYISSPPMRMPGDATTSACGKSVVADIVKDKTSHVEGLPELAAKDAGYHAAQCNLWLCRGVQFGDNAANVQSYTPGQVVNVKIALTIPHVGSANVSVVDTKTNAIIGQPLLSWPSGYADEKQFYGKTLPANQTDFNVTIPTTLDGKCATGVLCRFHGRRGLDAVSDPSFGKTGSDVSRRGIACGLNRKDKKKKSEDSPRVSTRFNVDII